MILGSIFERGYWKGFEELNEQSEIVKNLENNEFVEKLPIGKEDENKKSC